ncbi:MAG: RelA/SpoT domain-containing protein [Hyphomicrobium sp.]|uniref:hypothetical protein n=1 Tax=Hyphomicrobium sp. TaxID=82 RepID=UPI0039E6C8D2
MLYADFAKAVSQIIVAALDEAKRTGAFKSTAPQIQTRAKGEASLAKRLREKGLTDSDEIELHRKDLAGCRLIFYSNGAFNEFLSTRVLFDNFEIDESTKFHHPVLDDENASQFRSYNFVVRLKSDRAALPEYKRFAGLRCEVQVQTILNHAWSEATHDIGYKRGDSLEFGTQKLREIDERLTDIMLKYLAPAGHEFEKAQQDYDSVMKGLAISERGPLKNLLDAKDNNERWNVLDLIMDHYLPNLDAGTPAILSELLTTVEQAIAISRGTPRSTWMVGDFSVDGFDGAQVIRKAVELFEDIMRGDPEASLQLLMRLHGAAESTKERELYLKAADHLADIPYDLFQRYGGAVHLALIRPMKELSADDRRAQRALILGVGKNLLKPSLTSVKGSYRTFSFASVSISPGKDIGAARTSVVELLKFLYTDASTDNERHEVINALLQVASPPTQGQYSDELLVCILQDTLEVLRFLKAEMTAASFEVKNEIEYSAWNIHRMFCTGPLPQLEAISQLRTEISEECRAIRDALSSDSEFNIFKTLASFNSVYAADWEDGSRFYKRSQNIRDGEIETFMQSLDGNEDAWWQRLERCAAPQFSNGMSRTGLQKFLVRICSEKPKFIVDRLPGIRGNLARFLPTILNSLAESGHENLCVPIVREWIEKGVYLGEVASATHFLPRFSAEILPSLYESATASGDTRVVNETTAAIIANYDPSSGEHKALLLKAFKWLGDRGNADIVYHVWHLDGLKSVCGSLSDDEVRIILKSVMPFSQADHQLESFLQPISETNPRAVISFFSDRIAYSEQTIAPTGYDAIPFASPDLSELRNEVDFLLETAAALWRDNPARETEIGGLIKCIHPSITEPLRSPLIEFGRSSDRAKQRVFIGALERYEGAPEVFEVLKEVVASSSEMDSTFERDLHYVLDSLGVVNGSFGFVEAYNHKKKLIEPWNDGQTPMLAKFAKGYIAHLDRQRASEQNRAEQSVALEKLKWGEPIADVKPSKKESDS